MTRDDVNNNNNNNYYYYYYYYKHKIFTIFDKIIDNQKKIESFHRKQTISSYLGFKFVDGAKKMGVYLAKQS